MKTISKLLGLAMLLIGLTASAQTKTVGIPSGTMNTSYAAQEQSQWCWAASIEMVLDYYGVEVSQSDIVYNAYGSIYGTLPNWPGSWSAITRSLNNWGIDQDGETFVVASKLNWGAPSTSTVIKELASGHPIILAYQNPGTNTGHAVVLTGASYLDSLYGPVLNSVVVRDPWPGQGRKEYTGADFPGIVSAYWIIRVEKEEAEEEESECREVTTYETVEDYETVYQKVTTPCYHPVYVCGYYGCGYVNQHSYDVSTVPVTKKVYKKVPKTKVVCDP